SNMRPAAMRQSSFFSSPYALIGNSPYRSAMIELSYRQTSTVPPGLKSKTSGPENAPNNVDCRAVASNVWVLERNGLRGPRKTGVPGATGRSVLDRKSAMMAPPRTSLKSPSPVVTVRFLLRASTFLASSSSVGGLASAGAGVAGPVGGGNIVGG